MFLINSNKVVALIFPITKIMFLINTNDVPDSTTNNVPDNENNNVPD